MCATDFGPKEAGDVIIKMADEIKKDRMQEKINNDADATRQCVNGENRRKYDNGGNSPSGEKRQGIRNRDSESGGSGTCPRFGRTCPVHGDRRG